MVTGDIRDAALVERTFLLGEFDQVFHFAARAGVRPSIETPIEFLTTNIMGTHNLLRACQLHGVERFTFASSSSVYGPRSTVPFSETDALARTISPYATTKIAGEHLCSNYAHLFGIRCQCLRLFTVYGPRQRPDLAIAKFTSKILDAAPIQQYGNGSSSRDYTHIDDIVNGVMLAADYDDTGFEVFNLGGGQNTRLSELVAMIEEAAGEKAIVEILPDQAGDVPRTYADTSKARCCLGYYPSVDIRDGIKRYVELVMG